MFKEASIREPLILGDEISYHKITEDVARPVEGKANKMWWTAFTIAILALIWGMGCLAYTVGTGIGAWGANKTVGWAWDITNFVWWIGIGHAGTLISAVLLLFRQKWRMGINRSAEAMTIFAVVCAAIFPVFHMGRVWMAYWVMPIPNQFGSLWVNFNSPLLWDVFAISTYFTNFHEFPVSDFRSPPRISLIPTNFRPPISNLRSPISIHPSFSPHSGLNAATRAYVSGAASGPSARMRRRSSATSTSYQVGSTWTDNPRRRALAIVSPMTRAVLQVTFS